MRHHLFFCISIAKLQDEAKLTPDEAADHPLKTGRVIICQKKRKDGARVFWLIGKREMPVTPEAAIVSLQFVPRSARVERVCSSHKMIHSKAINRLKNESVQRFLYNYVNLRILTKTSTGEARDVFSDFEALLPLAEVSAVTEVGSSNDDDERIVLDEFDSDVYS